MRRSLSLLTYLFLLSASTLRAEIASDTLVRSLPQLLSPDRREEVLRRVDEEWIPELAPMLLELVPLSRDPRFAARMIRVLEKRTGEHHGYDLQAWYHWLWNRDPTVHPLYADFKAAIWGLVDPRFRGYFGADRPTRIRLDEIAWGGVKQDGIPPLRAPKLVPADAADYLADSDVVFAVAFGGEARAWPKRILAWHEMVIDRVGGIPITGVYCTLCGSMIAYRSTLDGVEHHFGTSGFLYRSNKLMFDQATQSLWNTLWGEPVVGPLVGKGLRLERLPVITTRWGEWRRRHPETTVLSLDTGHTRDYSEGAAYRDYFATDELMFGVPTLDRRLPNKAEVLALLLPSAPDRPLAISHRFLVEHPVHQETVGESRLVVLTDPSGAHRVYDAGSVDFASWNGGEQAVDAEGTPWRWTEDALRASDGRSLPRLPAHRAFWFGWYAAYPHTRLVDLSSPDADP